MEVRGAGKVVPGARGVKSPSSPSVCGTMAARGEKTVSISPYASASSALMKRSRSMSRSIVSIGWPVCWAYERVHLGAEIQDLARLDLDVGRRALRPAGGLVDHDPRVGQGAPLALGAGRQQERAHRRGHPHADRVHRRPEVLHRVVDRHARRDDAARRVDVEIDVLVGVVGLEKEQLGDDDVGDVVVDRRAHEDDPVHQQPREDVVGTLAPAGALDDVRRIESGHRHD